MRYAIPDMRYLICSAVFCSLRSKHGAGLLTLLLLPLLCTSVRAQRLDSLKADLRRDNPTLHALQLDYEAAMKIGAQQNQLPDLEIGAGVFVLPIETRTGPPWTPRGKMPC